MKNNHFCKHKLQTTLIKCLHIYKNSIECCKKHMFVSSLVQNLHIHQVTKIYTTSVSSSVRNNGHKTAWASNQPLHKEVANGRLQATSCYNKFQMLHGSTLQVHPAQLSNLQSSCASCHRQTCSQPALQMRTLQRQLQPSVLQLQPKT